jgi:hypothetical protein
LYLNETTCFDQNRVVLTKQLKKNRQTRQLLVFSTIHHLLPFQPLKTTQAMFLEHLMLHLSIKLDKPYTNMMT